MSALLDNGPEVTALYNHFFFESPRIFYMHVHGHGARQHESTISGGKAGVCAGQIDTAKIAQIVGHEGEQSAWA